MATAGSRFNRDVVAEEFEWKIENFSLKEEYESPEFKFQSETWSLLVSTSIDDEYTHVCIIRSSISGAPIAVELTLALKTSDGHKSCERGGMEFCDEWKYGVTYQMTSRIEFERRQPELLSSGCLTLILTMKKGDFLEPAGRRRFFRSSYIPVNSAPGSHETLPIATRCDAVKNVNASGEFEWKMDRFSLAGGTHWSPEFTMESERWEFEGISKRIDGYINLSVWRMSSGSPILVEFTFALQTSDGQRCFERFQTEIFHEWKHACHYGWMKTSEFEDRQSEFLSSGCLTVIVTVKIVESGKSASKSDRKILQDFKQMFLSEENKDVVLRVKGQEFSANKNVLMARSSVFASTFRNDMKEKKSGFVNIDDIDPSVFSDFLSFLYCEEIENLCKENVCDLFTAADKYDIADLRSMCLDFMKQNLSVDRFCETLVLAHLHNETDLVKTCTDFFVRNAEEIIESVKWELFAAENPKQSNELFLKYVKSTKHSKQ